MMKNHEDRFNRDEEVEVPKVISKDYQVMDILWDCAVSLVREDGTLQEDLKLPAKKDIKRYRSLRQFKNHVNML